MNMLTAMFVFVYMMCLLSRCTSQVNDTLFSNVFLIISNLDSENDDDNHYLWKEFNYFMEKYDKEYESVDEFRYRFSIFKENMFDIFEHNSGNHNFTLNMNHFTDLTKDEYRIFNGFSLYNKVDSRFGCEPFSPKQITAGDSIDWRDLDAVTSVKDQGKCGSCWTFSATGAIEGAWAISEQDLVDLSEQELVDCATGIKYGSHGCNGGQMDGAFDFVIENGQCQFNQYPYVSGETKSAEDCMNSCTPYAKISDCFDVEPNNQLALKQAVFQQPVAVAIEADTFEFQSYSSGILDTPKCGTQLDHGVLVVGYGEEDGQKYWLVKNSWSEQWGDNGYIKIARSESTNDPGICGIAMQPSFPIV